PSSRTPLTSTSGRRTARAGYLSGYGIEKTVRDPRVHQILEGTDEIMRDIVARGLTEAFG
ncbi:hypothetical protein GT039_38925, partial [Streptomyces sp. SID2955]|nr:hypothetical protein [Streptomyces sp. SID2955]